MLFRILGEVVVGLLVAGLALAVVVPAAMRLGYETGPVLGLVVIAGSLVGSMAYGRRRRKRRKTGDSP